MTQARNPSFILEITNRCNQNCAYCYNVWKSDSGYICGDLSPEKYIDILKKIITEGKPRIVTISGGEPMLNKNIFNIILYLKRKKIKTNLITNGTLLATSDIKKFIKLKVKLFELPLLSSIPKIHDKITGFDGGWKKTISSMREIKKQRGNLAVVIVLTNENIFDIKNTLELSIAIGADSILLNRANAGGKCSNNFDIMPNIPDLKMALDIANKLAEEYEVPINIGVPIQPCIIDISKYPNLKFGYCQAGKKYPYYAVDPLGNLRPCNHSNIILGNLTDQPLADILKSPLLYDFETSYPEECKNCIKLSECRGGCKASAEVCFGSYKKMEPFLKNNWDGMIKR